MEYTPADALATYCIVDGAGRRFLFNVQLLPPVAAAARRTAVRAIVDAYARRMFAKQGVAGLPGGNLLDVATDADGWRNV